MRKRDKLYTANKWNRPLFADVDRENQNIFDGIYGSSNIDTFDRAASQQYGANYGLSGYTLNDYMKSKGNNWLGLSKQDNPFSKGNIGTTMKGIGGAAAAIGSQVNTGDPRGLYDTLDPVYHLAGGRESKVGNAMSDAGVGLFNAGAQSGNGWLMLAGAGAKVLGGLTNAAFGVKEYKNNVETIKANSALARMTGRAFGNVSNENDFWNLASNLGSQSNFKWNDLYKNGWLTKKGKKKGNALIADDNSAMAYQTHNMVKAAEDIDSKMDEIAFANSYAFGGPLGVPMFGNTGMGAIDYGFMSDYLTAKNKQAENKNTASNPFAGVANNFFSDGGSIHIKKSHEGLFTEKANRAGMGVQEYASHVLANKENYPTSTVRQANFARNAKKFKHAYGGFLDGPKNIFDFGGDMQTNSADFSTGLTHISAGGSHEESPYDGVQLGVDSEGKPNLVEEGEVIFNDYVFSDRIPIDDETKKKFHFPKKRDITYAEAAKKLEKEISERPNDPISKSSFNAQMQQLEEQQERQKQEMEAARAREAFEALSPEEQAGVMRYAQQQEQAAQEQAMQQEAMAQQAQMQQPSPEEIAMAEQQQMGQPEAMTQEPQMAAYGGSVNRFDDGGKMREKIYNLLGFHTDNDFLKWAREHKLRGDDKWEASEDMLKGLAEDDEAWKSLINDETFLDAISDRPALIDAIKKGYDFGAYTPSLNGKATFDNNRGNWDMQTVQGWWGSQDPAWLEVMKKHPEITKDTNLDKKTLEKYISETDAFKKGTQWLQSSADNRLAYLQAIINNPEAPAKAKAYAQRFADENGWLNGKEVDYNTIFNNPSGRAANPGTYWKTPLEAVRDAQARNLVQNEDGTWTDIVGDIPKDWSSIGTYAWATPSTDFTYNYYRRPGRTFHAVEGDEDYLPDDQSKWTGVGNEVRRVNLPNGDTVVYHDRGNGVNGAAPAGTGEDENPKPKHKADWMRYAGLFGPAVGLGMQMAGIGKPDYSSLDAAVNGSGNAYLADYQPIGNYLRYNPMDIWFEQNRLNANARATDRAILNSGSNQGAKAAALLANGYNTQTASGDLYRKGLEYNEALKQQVAGFNRGTDQFNAEAYNRTSQFNADALNRARQFNRSLAMQAAGQKLASDAGWYNGIYGNVAGIFKGLSELGRENAQYNWLSDLAADGVFGNLGTSYTGQRYIEDKNKKNNAAKGGKLKKKGLTF